MSTHWFSVTLLNDVIVSASAATTGGHQCLDYIPGSTILGAIAAAFYKNAAKNGTALHLFHGSALRCSNAYPYDLDTHQRALPMPLSFHLPKSQKTGHAVNAAIKPLPFDNATQWQQQRSGFLFQGQYAYIPPRVNRMKTAIDRDKICRAKEAQLFEYQALPAGSTWAFSLSFPNRFADIEPSVLDFLKSPSIRLGRSRSAEYGAVSITPIAPLAPPPSQPNASRCLIYLASDTALMSNGQPRLIPHAADFGLPESAAVDWNHTFLRSRSFAPYNAFRRAYDCQRVLLQKGSIITFSCPEGYDPDQVHSRCASGIGLFTNEGCGEAYANPAWLMKDFMQIDERQDTAGTQPHAPDVQSLAEHPTFALMHKRYIQMRLTPLAMELGEKWGGQWFHAWKKAQNNADDGRVPTKTQWAHVRTAAVAAMRAPRNRLEDFKSRLASVFEHGLARKLWHASTGRETLAHDIKKALDITCAIKLLQTEDQKLADTDAADLVAVRACYYAAINVTRKIAEQRS